MDIRRTFIGLSVAASLSWGFSARSDAATLISTLPRNSAAAAIGEFLPGEIPREATFGQTITVPAQDNVLTGFQFTIDDSVIDPETVVNPFHFDAFVFAWDGEKASGSPLFSAGPFSTTNPPAPEVFNFDTGNLSLTPGNQYVLFISTSNRYDGIHDGALVDLVIGGQFGGFDPYSGASSLQPGMEPILER